MAGRRRGMTMIELLVVMAILLSVMSVLSLGVYRVSSTVDPRGYEASIVQRPVVAAGPALAAPPVIEATALEIALTEAETVLEGFGAHTAIEARVRGVYRIHSVDAGATTLTLALPLPPQVTVREVAVSTRGSAGASAGARLEDGALWWSTAVSPGEVLTAEVSYVATGLDGFRYTLDASNRPVDVVVELTAPPGVEITVPDDALAPTERGDGRLRWAYTGVLNPDPVAFEVPGDRTALGRIAMVCRLAAVGMLLFGAGFWYASEGERPGRLDDFRLGGLLVLGLNYALFYAVYAVAGAWIPPSAAFACAALTALPLLGLHLAHLAGARFALTRALPVALVSIAAVFAWVYAEPYRSLTLVTVGVGAIATVTVTFRGWTDERAAAAASQGRQAARAVEADRVRTLADALERALGGARRSRDLGGAAVRSLGTGLLAERARLVAAIADLERAIEVGEARVQDGWWHDADEPHPPLEPARHGWGVLGEDLVEATNRVGSAARAVDAAVASAASAVRAALTERFDAEAALERAVDDARVTEADMVVSSAPWVVDPRLADAVATLRSLRERAEAFAPSSSAGACPDRGGAAEARRLASLLDTARAEVRGAAARRAEAGSSHCAACGCAQAVAGRFCSGCGAERPVELVCATCGEATRVPRQLLADGWRRVRVCCMRCGAAVDGEACAASPG